ncbi:hypothetical protein I5F71_02950 [Pseudomonas aeruginosa]|nr:hypothetical protein [Pseudomonas aeruginosa]MBG4718206.1 hypothetical protein [Pseudomonas aeruginosa]HEJ3062526.1 hypothetical protein [Pseudomonas aeruginosa]
MSNSPANYAKENEIKARFDDETFDEILAQCRRLRVRRAVLVRQIVQEWLAQQPAEQRAEIKSVRNAA